MYEVLMKIGRGILKILHPSELAHHPNFKSYLNTIFLIFSCMLIVSSYTAGISKIITKIGSIIVLVTLDVAIQWVLGLSKTYWKTQYISRYKFKINWNKFKAGILLFLWLLYVLVYAVPTAVGFFMNTFSTQNEIITQVTNDYDFYNDEYKQNKTTIDNLNNQLAVEAKTVHGKRSEKVVNDLEVLKKRQRDLSDLMRSCSKQKITVAESSDQTMKIIAETFGLTEKLLTLIAYSCTVLMIYVFLLLTAWDVPIINQQKSENTLDEFKKELLAWVDAAFEGRNNGALNGVNTIADKTGFSVEKCMQIRKYLSELKVNGGMAISVEQGVCKNNYPQQFIKNYIINH